MLTITPAPGSGWAHAFLDVNALARHTPWLHTPLALYAQYGIVLFAVLLLAGWWTARRRGELRMVAAAVWAPIGVLAAVAVNQPIVAAIHEHRPYAVLPQALVLIPHTTDPSFPSDHATMAGAATVGLALLDRRLGMTTALAAVVMAFSRVYVGAHFPHDVLAGLALGALVATAGYHLIRRPLTALLTHLTHTRLRRVFIADNLPPHPARERVSPLDRR